MIANTRLVDYGIQSCESEYTVHVCPKSGKVYVFRTQIGQELARTHLYLEKSVWTKLPGNKRCETAKGYPVPWNHFAGIRFYDIPDDLLRTHGKLEKASTSQKGGWAEQVFQKMCEHGLIDHDTTSATVDDLDRQIRGIDVEVQAPTYQVKYDGPGGHKEFGGTGNLFLQTQECNPLGLH